MKRDTLSGHTEYILDGQFVLSERDSTGLQTRRYHYGQGQPVGLRDSGGLPQAGAGGGAGGERHCDGDGCGTPGVCRPRASPTDCGGGVQTVCGCDGTTYLNDCWARVAGARVKYRSECKDGG